MNEEVKHVDWGIPNAVSYFGVVVLPNIVMFEASPTIQFAMNAVQSLWNLHEWYWYDTHPNQNPRHKGNQATYKAFQDQLIQERPEIGHIRDLAEAAKHCGLGRRKPPLAVKSVGNRAGRGGVGGYGIPAGGYSIGALAYGSSSPQPVVTFDDGSSPCWLGDIVNVVKSYWHQKLQFDQAMRHPPPSSL